MTKKTTSHARTNLILEGNAYKMKQITLYTPVQVTKGTKWKLNMTPIDKNLAGFTSPEEAERLAQVYRAKYPENQYKVVDVNLEYADSYEQYKMWRDNAHELQASSFNNGSIKDIKKGLFTALTPHGSFAGLYSNRSAAVDACKAMGCQVGEEQIIVRGAFATYNEYKRFLRTIAKSEIAER